MPFNDNFGRKIADLYIHQQQQRQLLFDKLLGHFTFLYEKLHVDTE